MPADVGMESRLTWGSSSFSASAAASNTGMLSEEAAAFPALSAEGVGRDASSVTASNGASRRARTAAFAVRSYRLWNSLNPASDASMSGGCAARRSPVSRGTSINPPHLMGMGIDSCDGQYPLCTTRRCDTRCQFWLSRLSVRDSGTRWDRHREPAMKAAMACIASTNTPVTRHCDSSAVRQRRLVARRARAVVQARHSFLNQVLSSTAAAVSTIL